MSKSMGAAAVIFNTEGHILLVKHSYGKNNWELPGGKSEEKESAEETAKREVYEETGLVVNIGKLIGIYYDPDYDMHHFAFIATYDGSDLAPIPSSPEIVECRFCSLDELPRPISDFTYYRIRDSLNDSEQLFHVIGPRKWME